MYRLWEGVLAVCLLGGMISCNKGEGETVDSAYIEPIMPPPQYKFSRNGANSVDLLECDFLKAPLDYIYSSYLKEARMGSDYEYTTVFSFYNEGEFGLKPKEEIAQSLLHKGHRQKILEDMAELLNISAHIGGYKSDDPYKHRTREAVKGRTGYVGNNIGDKNIYFVDEKGVAVADVFKNAVKGAIYLDKILNVHLDDSVLDNKDLQRKHESMELPAGKNYTELEHHWDLAYGYYIFWKPLAEAGGLPILRDSERNIFQAFVRGRMLLETFRYDEIKEQVRIIREELSKVIVVRAMDLLVGENTLVNMDERPKYAFLFLSQACGLIYAAQFTRSPEGMPYFTYEEVKGLLASLTRDAGLWEKNRLLEEENVEGSLKNIALALGQMLNVSLEEIKK